MTESLTCINPSAYPDLALATELYCALGLDGDNALLTAGSDDALDYITDYCVHQETPCFVFVPTYGYALSIIERKSNNVTRVALCLTDSLSCSLSSALEFYSDSLASQCVVYLANPSNPIGTFIPSSQIETIALAYPHTTFVIDEAYIEFADALDTCAPYTLRCANLIVTRTFSKAYGLAGVRLGYLIAHSTVIHNLQKVYNEKRVTSLAMRAGLAVMKNRAYYHTCILKTQLERQILQKTFQERGWFYIPSQANFVMFYAPKGHSIFEDHGITVRNLEYHPGFEGFLRVTIGNAAHMTLFRDILHTMSPPTLPLVSMYTPKSTVWAIKNMFKKLASVLNDSPLREKYWLDSGSLLGWHRNQGGMIPWDDDVDIGILNEDVDTLLALRERLLANGLRLKLNRTEMYYQIDESTGDTTGDVHIDIFPFVMDGAYLVNADPRFVSPDIVRCNFRYAPKDLFPLQEAMWYNKVQVNIPKSYEKILHDNIPSDFMHVACVELKGKRTTHVVSRWVAA